MKLGQENEEYEVELVEPVPGLQEEPTPQPAAPVPAEATPDLERTR